MLSNIGGKLKHCSIIGILLSSLLWLSLLIVYRLTQSDMRVKQLKLLGVDPQAYKQIFLRKLDLPFNLRKFELIGIMNHKYPNTIGDDAFLIISAQEQETQKGYIRLFENMQKAYSDDNKIPTYVLQNKDSLIYPNPKYVEIYTKEIEFVLDYLVNQIGIKKITILTFQQGSLLTYRSLAQTSRQIFSFIEKLVLINIYNPSIRIYDNEPSQFLQQTKRIIFSNQTKMAEFNNLRIINIRTLDAHYPVPNAYSFLEQYKLFQLGYEFYRLKNTVSISTRFMWNVYCQLNPDQYFHFEPFIWLLTKFFVEDRQFNLSTKDIQYLFHYRQSFTPRQLTPKQKHKFITANCIDFPLQTYRFSGNIFTQMCVNLVRKDYNYFMNSSLILFSQKIQNIDRSFQVYGQKYEKLYPIESKLNRMVYLVQNVWNLTQIYIINPKKTAIKMIITPGYEPKNNPILQRQNQQLSLSSKKIDFGMTFISICPGHKLIYPTHFLKPGSYGNSLVMMKPVNQICYTDSSGFQLNWPKLMTNWGMERNVAIFTAFCSHVTQTSTYSRFYIQWFVNQIMTLTLVQDKQGFLLWQNMVVISLVVLMQLMLKVFTLISQYLGVPKAHLAKLMLIPLILQIGSSCFHMKSVVVSHWNVLSLVGCSLLNKKNEHIFMIQMYFMSDYIFKNQSNLWGMSLIIIWMCVTSISTGQQHQVQSKTVKLGMWNKNSIYSEQLMIKITNTGYLCLVALCLGQSAIIVHYLVDFYVITYALLIVRRKFNQLIVVKTQI